MSTKIYPKEWDKDLTYLKSPHSNIVHFCYRTQAKEEYGMETRTAMPMCGVWCWKNVVPVLVEDIQNKPELRLCKTCVGYLDDDFWEDQFATRVDFLSLEHCLRDRGE